jgi:hypothetical protein
VEIDSHSKKDYDLTSNGELIGNADHEDDAASVAGTCCHTFSPRH